MTSAADPKNTTPPTFNRLRSFFVVLQQDSERLRQEVIKKVFSNNSNFRSSSGRASLAASQDTWLETAHTSNEASSHNSPLISLKVAYNDFVCLPCHKLRIFNNQQKIVLEHTLIFGLNN
ncbi:hypothetical protein DPMN_116708 [Dreissena polymorpha]|uniref:Uncharacterized protein n=1 Tax=Dreissena polymorpha TaxID=45954 RepID=A0A9D4QUI5_DREPO|nr:hypothetical protein DPMN_116708 [Dreissena polymorpha]